MKKLFVVLLIVPLLSFSVHKYYIALTEIEYKEETHSVQMIMNVFMDDIETAINQDYNVDLQLSTKKELKNSDEYFFKYLKEHFKVLINNQKIEYNFIGKEYDGNIVYFYLEIENVLSIESIEIQNDVLIKYFPDQQNLIKASIKKERKSLFLTKKNDKGLLNF
ncbi:hypothetical protein H3Z83_00240 [Tenacibaculum sp. S7007]|uniref:Peptidase E n=1 Tax=Tenacibaculum pelagium TaxID=2759527 RepID=A0A839AIC8_9FLAO|nr:DUF6702 family protein [Tenacibaculum pelagium]MBA6154952.1 hypothetical protein [Tenacibaculum pelagium]